MMTTGGEGSDRSVGRDASPPSPNFRVARAFARPPFRVLKPTTWPAWFWWLVTILWCAAVSTLCAALSRGAAFWPAFGVFMACTVGTNVAVMTWNSYQRRRKANRP